MNVKGEQSEKIKYVMAIALQSTIFVNSFGSKWWHYVNNDANIWLSFTSIYTAGRVHGAPVCDLEGTREKRTSVEEFLQ